MTIVKPRSWVELNQALWRYSKDRRLNIHRPIIAYRGLPKNFPDLRTGFQRLGAHKVTRWREKRIIETFRLYAREHFDDKPNDWDILYLGQHHRLPTRLLDWTASPYVALFFATETLEHDRYDGVIWCVRRRETNRVLPDRLKRHVRYRASQIFTIDTLTEEFPHGLDDFDDLPRDTFLWFEPPSLSPRIVNQYALFSLMPGCQSRHDLWLETHPEWYWKVLVPARLKKEIRRRLQVMNVTERIIYPGLEGIARWLRCYYTS